MWLTTFDGLVRFEGVRFSVFNKRNSPGLPSNDVKAIHEVRDGSFWLATYGGVAQFKDGRYRTFTEKVGVARDHVGAIYEAEQGTFGSEPTTGLSRFRDGKFMNYTMNKGLYSNGTGRNPQFSGFGLTGLRERLRMFGGRQIIHSAPGQSTKIHITNEAKKAA